MGTLSGYLSPVDRYNLARGAGFTSPDAIVMSAISMLECGNCDMSSVNKSGDSSLWQINAVHNYSVSWLADPVNSAKAAYSVWSGVGGGTSGFKQWCTYPGGCGGASPISWTQFGAVLTQVQNALISSGTLATPTLPGGIPIPGLPGQPPAPPPQQDPGGNPIVPPVPAPGQTPAPASPTGGIAAGSIGPYNIKLPSGLILALIGVFIVLIGGMVLISSNDDARTAVTTAVAA